ncbi:MAG: adenylate/guanylate cyclase domain-containing protein [Proteobacteria bacterium]|nr:adenylate/guanylate cyclase domain-containing protein [Pseudomonadota bacterium]
MSAVIPFPRHQPGKDKDTTCFLIADLETAIAGPAPARSSAPQPWLARHESLIGRIISESGGRVFKSAATRSYAAFASVGPAIAAALELQRAFIALGPNDGIALRAGIHAGLAELVGNDYVGAALNRAARLAAIAHGDQVLISAAAARMVDAAELPDFATIDRLGWFRLRDLLEPEAVHQLTHPDLRADFPPLRSLDSGPHNLPLLSNFCIGRNQELAVLGELLDHHRHRLISIVGPGGIGKTRLALQCGAENLAWFPDGVWFVDVGVLSEAGQVAEAVCTLLGFKFGGDRTAAELLPSLLRHKRLMIVFDNCAHLAGQVGILATELLRGCRDVTVLATSRTPIGVEGEYCMALGGHGLPGEGGDLTLATAMAAPAIRLFVARARQAVADFKLTEANLPIVAAVCGRLDGSALAIELAAARLRQLSPAELLRSLSKGTGSPLDAPDPGFNGDHALDRVIEASYEILDADQRVAFARLAVFGGSFTLDAARETIGMSPLRPSMVPGLVSALIDQSMLTRVPGWSDETRYRLADTVRRHAIEKLRGDAARHDVMDRLCAWLIRHYGEGERIWAASRADEWLARYRCDIDNLRTALAWAFNTSAGLLPRDPGSITDTGNGNTAAGLMLVSLTSELWRDMGMTAEQRHWLNVAQPRIGAATPDRVAARIGLDIAFASGGGAFGDKRRVGDALDALARYKTVGNAEDIALAASRIAVCVMSPVDTSAAQPYVALIEAALPNMGRTRRRAWLLNVLAAMTHFAGDSRRAIALLDEAVAISRHFRDQVNIQIAGLNLGEFLFAQGDVGRAAEEATAVAASCRETGNLLDLAFSLGNLAAYAMVLNDTPRARAALAEALPLAADINIEFVLMSCLQTAALLAAREGALHDACRLAGHAGHFYAVNALAREATEAAIDHALSESLDQAEASGALAHAERVALTEQGAGLKTRHAIELATQNLAGRA